MALHLDSPIIIYNGLGARTSSLVLNAALLRVQLLYCRAECAIDDL